MVCVRDLSLLGLWFVGLGLMLSSCSCLVVNDVAFCNCLRYVDSAHLARWVCLVSGVLRRARLLRIVLCVERVVKVVLILV